MITSIHSNVAICMCVAYTCLYMFFSVNIVASSVVRKCVTICITIFLFFLNSFFDITISNNVVFTRTKSCDAFWFRVQVVELTHRQMNTWPRNRNQHTLSNYIAHWWCLFFLFVCLNVAVVVYVCVYMCYFFFEQKKI